jgi:electron transfer flavoprotein alpha subunit
VLAVVFGEHKESAFATAGVDRLLVLEGEEFSGYAPEQRVQGLRAVDNQFAPRHWLLPDSRSGGGELGRRLAAAWANARRRGSGRSRTAVHRPRRCRPARPARRCHA